MPVRCLIVDDSPTVQRAMRELLVGEGVTVVGMAATGGEAVRLARQLEPDVILVDIDLGPESGFDLVRRLAERRGAAASHSILTSTHDEQDFAELIAASPAVGFIAKSQLSAQAIHALLHRDGEQRP